MHTNGARAATGRALHAKPPSVVLVAFFSLFSGCISPTSAPTENSRSTGGSNANPGSGGASNSAGGTPVSVAGTGTGGKAEVTAECRASTECAPPTPYCVAGRCVECTTNANCSGTSRHYCNTNNNKCAICLTEAQCGAAEPYCSTEGDCVQCLSTRNCGTTDAACDPVVHRCVSICSSDDDCSVDVGRPFCNSKVGECVQCVADEDCPPIRAHCLLNAGTCEKCAADADCAPPTPYCDDKSHACTECAKNGDCRTGYFCQAGACVIIPE